MNLGAQDHQRVSRSPHTETDSSATRLDGKQMTRRNIYSLGARGPKVLEAAEIIKLIGVLLRQFASLFVCLFACSAAAAANGQKSRGYTDDDDE